MKCFLMNPKGTTMTTMVLMDPKWEDLAHLTSPMQIVFSSISSHPQDLITKKMKISLEAFLERKKGKKILLVFLPCSMMMISLVEDSEKWEALVAHQLFHLQHHMVALVEKVACRSQLVQLQKQ